MRALVAMVVLVGCVGEPAVATTRTYVVSEMGIPYSTPELAVGHDLDDRVSDGSETTCVDAHDFTSPVTGRPGIDNQMAQPPLIGTPSPDRDNYRSTFLDHAAAGRLLLLVEVTSVGFDDPSARVRIFTAESAGPLCDGMTSACPAGSRCPDGATPETPAPCGPVTAAPVAPDVTGVLVADQTFVPRDLVIDAPAEIRDGRLVLSVPLLELPFVLGEALARSPLRDARLEGRIDETAITDAELGSAVRVDDIVALAMELGLTGIDEGTIRALSGPDLEPDATGECQAISMGMLLSAVRARVAP